MVCQLGLANTVHQSHNGIWRAVPALPACRLVQKVRPRKRPLGAALPPPLLQGAPKALRLFNSELIDCLGRAPISHGTIHFPKPALPWPPGERRLLFEYNRGDPHLPQLANLLFLGSSARKEETSWLRAAHDWEKEKREKKGEELSEGGNGAAEILQLTLMWNKLTARGLGA